MSQTERDPAGLKPYSNQNSSLCHLKLLKLQFQNCGEIKGQTEKTMFSRALERKVDVDMGLKLLRLKFNNNNKKKPENS